MSFRVDLSIFRGPLDLLLYLVRKHEVDIVDIPIAPITDQFLAHLAVLEQLDVDAVGDFLEMASTLIEIKSRMVLPAGDEVEEPLEDPRQDLVRRLLEYKKFKDAASILEERSREWQEHFPRLASDLAAARRRPGRATDPRSRTVGPGQRVRPLDPGAARQPARRASSTTTRRSMSTWNGSADLLDEQQRWRSPSCSSPACTNRPWSACSWRFWSWSAITARGPSRIDLFGEIWILPVAGAGDAQDYEPDESPQ